MEKRHEEFFELIENKTIGIDEIIDPSCGHRIVHMAVIFDDEIILNYLIGKKANLMARDYNGYTPMLKAACLGRFDMVKKFISNGVYPYHKDPWGDDSKTKVRLVMVKKIGQIIQ